jgi:uncharacterized membrane protein required for colicin V production
VLLVQLAVLTVRGLLRGTIAQVFAFLGLCAGAWVMVAAGGWLGQHWQGARPVAVFFTLRWLVAVLAGLAVAAVFQWCGELAAKAAHDGPLGWVDRVVGGAIGAATGLVLAALVTLAMLQGPVLAAIGRVAEHGLATRPLVHGGVVVSKAGGPWVPGAAWLHGRFVSAARRLDGGPAPARAATGR